MNKQEYIAELETQLEYADSVEQWEDIMSQINSLKEDD